MASSPTQRVMMMSEQTPSETNLLSSSSSSDFQTPPAHSRHPLITSPPAGPIVHREQQVIQLHNPSGALLSEQNMLALQQQLQGILQLVGTGGTELHRQMQIFTSQTLQEFEQVKNLLSAADVSSVDKWTTLSQWAYKVDSFLTHFTTNSLPELQRCLPIFQNCLRQPSSTDQPELTTTPTHHHQPAILPDGVPLQHQLHRG